MGKRSFSKFKLFLIYRYIPKRCHALHELEFFYLYILILAFCVHNYDRFKTYGCVLSLNGGHICFMVGVIKGKRQSFSGVLL